MDFFHLLFDPVQLAFPTLTTNATTHPSANLNPVIMNIPMMVSTQNNQIPAMVLMKMVDIPRAIRELLTAHVMDLQIARRMTYRALAYIDALIIRALFR